MSQTKSTQNNEKESYYYYLKICVKGWLFFAACCAALIMIILHILGFWEIAKGILIFCRLIEPQPGITSTEKVTLEMVFKGIEFIFLGTVAYFVLFSLGQYSEHSDKAKFIGAKALVIGLLVAVIATDLVSKILKPDGLDFNSAIYESLVIFVLSLFYFGLEWLSEKSKAK